MEHKINVIDYYLDLESRNVLIYYKGPFMAVVLSEISKKIREKFKDNPKVNKKVFSIFIELAQNISYYSEERNFISDQDRKYGNGVFLISENNEKYTLTSGNLIKSEWANEVIEKCEMINKLDNDGLRKLKRELRSQAIKDGHIGGNIGLVDVALKAESPLQVEIMKINEIFSYFTLTIDVPKKE